MPEKKDDEKQQAAAKDDGEKAPAPKKEADLNANDIKLSDEPNNTINAPRR